MDSGLGYLAVVLAVVLFSMTFHEAMHAFASNWLGDDTARQEGRLTLNPIAHIDPLATVLLPLLLAALGAPPFGAAKPVPFNPSRVRYGEFGAALVGLAGPVTNLVLAFLGFVVLALSGFVSNWFGGLLQVFILVNLAFFVFNMIPLPPLDGSRLLYAIAPDNIRQIMVTMEQYGIYLILIIVLLFNAQLGQFMQSAIGSILNLFKVVVGV
ncbi:MAG: site-2 protease family protein [Candidatus Chaera renei]|uniref:Site-2 protease family protein n=1 Tax=Candidatus Chaera renei TaxID=2506947 RepID=A0A4Q0AJE7_9BACT|nr:MAG: site-2 protease family protein [Candidatus Chaera renei]